MLDPYFRTRALQQSGLWLVEMCVNIHILYLLDSYGWLNLLVSVATSKNRSFQKISQTNDKLLFHLFRGLIFIV